MIFYTSDDHFGHQKIIELSDRPFSSVDEMNEELIRRWNSRVMPHHMVYVLGDFLMGQKAESFKIPARLNGEIVLIPGNHDMCHSMHKKCDEWRVRYLETGISRIASETSVRFFADDVPVTISHFPPQGDSTDKDERFGEYRPDVEQTDWVIHGHVHNLWRQRGRWINVGVDAWGGYPVPKEQLESMIQAGPQNLAPLEW